MRLGLDAKKDEVLLAAKHGFDYLEISLDWLLTSPKGIVDETESMMKEHGLRAEVLNCFFNPSVKLLGEERDMHQIADIIHKNLEMSMRMNAEVVVIGSGKARSLPDGYCLKKAKEEFGEIVDLCATEFSKKGIKIVVEPIRRAESNFINTVLEGVDFAKGINNPNLGYMVDLFHFHQNGENLCDLDLLKGQLTHAHIARPNLDRNGPKPEDEETIRLWMQKLKEIGYDDRLTLECIWTPDIETAMGDTARIMPLMRGEF